MRIRPVLTVLVVLALIAGVGVYVMRHNLRDSLPLTVGRACEVRTGSGTVALDADQMANAATIAAVGIRRDLPDQAIVIALATAFQESKLRNLDGGDRDSVGLFQQRPSQGWGTAEQISDPRYAARKFYAALTKIKGWQQMRITEAAQRVQRSAYPEAYEKWADESTVLTGALAGRVSRALTCTQVGEPAVRGVAAAQALTASLRLDWGDLTTVDTDGATGLKVSARTEQVGWQFAHWLVAHSAEKSVERVRFDDQEWTSYSGQWRQVARTAGGGDRVVADVYPTA